MSLTLFHSATPTALPAGRATKMAESAQLHSASRLEEEGDWARKGLAQIWPAYLSQKSWRWVVDIVKHGQFGDQAGARFDCISYIKSLEAYKSLSVEEKAALSNDDDLLQNFSEATEAVQRQVYDWLLLHTAQPLLWIITKITLTSPMCGSCAWQELLQHFEPSTENTKSAAMVSAVKTVII